MGPDGVASGVQVPPGETLRVDAGRLCYQTLLAGSEGAPEGAGARRVTVVLGLDDNPKLGLQAGAPAGGATLNGQPLADWLAGRGLAPEHLWPGAAGGAGEGRTLWEAKLFVADGDDPYRRILTWLQRPPLAPESAGGLGGLAELGLSGVRERWLAAERFSLRDLLERSDAAALAAWRGALMGDVAAARVVGDVRGGATRASATSSPASRRPSGRRPGGAWNGWPPIRR